MEDPNPAKTVSEELARRDLGDIRALQESEEFNRYWLRRLADKRKLVAGHFKNDPPTQCDDREREILRRLLLAYEELEGLMKTDEGSIQSQLSRR